LLVNTLASTAMPMTPPSSRIAFVAPDAWPVSSWRTELSTAFAEGAKTSAIPAPAIMNGTTSCPYGTVGVDTAASQATPPAWSASPVAISGREPTRSDSSPAIGAISIGIAVHGSVRIPASSGESPCVI
jgi:hypothetical protein